MTRQILFPTGIRFDSITPGELNKMAIAHAKEHPGETLVLDGDTQTICICKYAEDEE